MRFNICYECKDKRNGAREVFLSYLKPLGESDDFRVFMCDKCFDGIIENTNRALIVIRY